MSLQMSPFWPSIGLNRCWQACWLPCAGKGRLPIKVNSLQVPYHRWRYQWLWILPLHIYVYECTNVSEIELIDLVMLMKNSGLVVKPDVVTKVRTSSKYHMDGSLMCLLSFLLLGFMHPPLHYCWLHMLPDEDSRDAGPAEARWRAVYSWSRGVSRSLHLTHSFTANYLKSYVHE